MAVLTKQTGLTCRIFMRTTSSLAGSVPTNLACVTASAMFSMASAAASWLASANRQQTEGSQSQTVVTEGGAEEKLTLVFIDEVQLDWTSCYIVSSSS